jgi:hypothetical protein
MFSLALMSLSMLRSLQSPARADARTKINTTSPINTYPTQLLFYKYAMAMSMVNSIVKWNPFCCSFVSYDSKLRLYDVVTLPNGSREAILSKSMPAVSGEVTTLDWYQDSSAPKALAFGTSVASVYFLNWSKSHPEYVALRQAKKSRQQCTEVVWNAQLPNQVAAGFDKSKK